MNKEQLKLELKELATFLFLSDGEPEVGHYSCDSDPPFDDFNKDVFDPRFVSNELRPPGEVKDQDEIDFEKYIHDNGILGIRADDNFWIVAYIPYKFKELTIQEIVAILWLSKASTARYHGDASDKEYWRAYFKPQEDAILKRKAARDSIKKPTFR